MKQKLSDQYLKVVEWSQQDKCYVGTAPGLMIGGVHGKDEHKVFQELCQVVDEVIKTLQEEGKPLPKPIINKRFSGNIALRVPPDLHKRLAIKAAQKGESLNKLIHEQLKSI